MPRLTIDNRIYQGINAVKKRYWEYRGQNCDVDRLQDIKARLSSKNDVFKIVVFGGSNVNGGAYVPEGHWVAMLAKACSERLAKPAEVVNLCKGKTGGTANSTNMLRLLNEAVELKPDLAIVEISTNETSRMSPYHQKLLQTNYLNFITGKPLILVHQEQSSGSDASAEEEIDATFDTYRNNLAEMVKLSEQHHFHLAFLDFETNLRDWPPVLAMFSKPVSEQAAETYNRLPLEITRMIVQGGRDGEVQEGLATLASIDDDNAVFHYLSARNLDAAGKDDEARQAYLKAVALDVCKGRYLQPRFLEHLREMVKGDNLSLISVRDMVWANSAQTAPGFDVFEDMTHYSLKIHHMIFQAVAGICAKLSPAFKDAALDFDQISNMINVDWLVSIGNLAHVLVSDRISFHMEERVTRALGLTNFLRNKFPDQAAPLVLQLFALSTLPDDNEIKIEQLRELLGSIGANSELALFLQVT